MGQIRYVAGSSPECLTNHSRSILDVMRDIDTQAPATTKPEASRHWMWISFLIGFLPVAVGLMYKCAGDVSRWGGSPEQCIDALPISVLSGAISGALVLGLVWLTRKVFKRLSEIP